MHCPVSIPSIEFIEPLSAYHGAVGGFLFCEAMNEFFTAERAEIAEKNQSPGTNQKRSEKNSFSRWFRKSSKRPDPSLP